MPDRARNVPIVVQVAQTLARSLKAIALTVGGVLVVLGGISLLAAHPLATFLRALSYLGIAMTVVSVAVMLLTFRQARDVQPVALLVSVATTVVSALVSLWLAPLVPSGLVLIAALVLGGGVGVGWAFTTLLFIDGSHVRVRGTIWSLAVWAATFALNQIMATATGHASPAATILLIGGTGLSLGNTLGLLARARQAAALAAATARP
ncbi:MAG: hypothetical protein P4M07_10005 [Xanthobacteraceae bacterium]|nr:hypothetical protein [Xanthobacteraceae bacterium]